MEIEKKFKIKKLPDNLEQYEQKHIEQGYLCTNPVVRIRKSNDRYILTYKSLVSGSEDKNTDVRINNEVEVFLTKEGYEHLREKVDDNLIKKTRYIIPLEDGHMGELDIFGGVPRIREGLGHAVIRNGNGGMAPTNRLLDGLLGIRQGIHIAHLRVEVQLHTLFSNPP